MKKPVKIAESGVCDQQVQTEDEGQFKITVRGPNSLKKKFENAKKKGIYVGSFNAFLVNAAAEKMNREI